MKEKIKKYYPIFIIILIILGAVFYWYEWRPMQIRRECYNTARLIWGKGSGDLLFENEFKDCLLEHGLEK
jgi:hypothetical protein